MLSPFRAQYIKFLSNLPSLMELLTLCQYSLGMFLGNVQVVVCCFIQREVYSFSSTPPIDVGFCASSSCSSR